MSVCADNLRSPDKLHSNYYFKAGTKNTKGRLSSVLSLFDGYSQCKNIKIQIKALPIDSKMSEFNKISKLNQQYCDFDLI